MLKKALIYLGLGPDEAYDQFADGERGVEAVRPVPTAAPQRPSGSVRPVGNVASGTTSVVRAVPAGPGAVTPAVAVQSRERVPVSRGGQPKASAIKIIEPVVTKPYASSPTSFNEVQEIGDRFKSGQPVIVNLQGVDRDLRRRLIDFSSGLCYALGGKMDKVAVHVYMLMPADVEVSAADAQRALD